MGDVLCYFIGAGLLCCFFVFVEVVVIGYDGGMIVGKNWRNIL